MGMYLLNISVDPADPNPQYIPEDLSINDQESIIEIVVEQLLGFDDAFEEFDDHDTQEHSKKGLVKIDLMTPCSASTMAEILPAGYVKPQFSDPAALLLNGFPTPDSPPPNA